MQNEKKHTKNAEHELQHSHLKSIRTPTPRSGSSLPGRGELHRCAPSVKWIPTSWAEGANRLHRPIAGQGSCRQLNRETQSLPKKEQHFIQGQHTRPKEGHPRGEEAEVTRNSLLLVSGLRHRPENMWGVTFSLLAEVHRKTGRGGRTGPFLPMTGPGLDIKIKKASSDRER